jgi:hypothetical protein
MNTRSDLTEDGRLPLHLLRISPDENFIVDPVGVGKKEDKGTIQARLFDDVAP